MIRTGKISKDVRVADNLEELPSHAYSHTCQCKCGAVWRLDDALRCPDCGSRIYKVVGAPENEYALEG